MTTPSQDTDSSSLKRIQAKRSEKQKTAFNILTDQETTEVLYGGGAGGGKSYLGCLWLLFCCLKYPGSRWLMGRAILKTLKESTLLTFFRICHDMGLKPGEDFKYNSMSAVVTFPNGSEIYLKDLFAYPSDPEFDELGSTEYTGEFIDEASQITKKAYDIAKSRIRYKLDEFGLIPKILIATNPTKNFIYSEFYRPFMEGKLPKHMKFVSALVGDNPYISRHYLENLGKLDKNSKERLLFGNWEYDDDPTVLFEYDKILDIFTNPEREERGFYISADVARFGEDKTVIMVWNGLRIIKIVHFGKKSTEFTEKQIGNLAEFYKVPKSNIVVDDDGIGGGVVDHLKVKGFVNNSSPLETGNKKYNFANLKSQCYFKLAEIVNLGGISCCKIDGEIRGQLTEDLEQIKWHNPDKDTRIQVTPKEDIKERTGRSPDFGDCMMMRMLFEVKPKIEHYVAH